MMIRVMIEKKVDLSKIRQVRNFQFSIGCRVKIEKCMEQVFLYRWVSRIRLWCQAASAVIVAQCGNPQDQGEV